MRVTPKSGLMNEAPRRRGQLLDECYRRKLKLQLLRTSGQRGVGVARGPWIPRMRQRNVGAVLSSTLVWKQPLTEAPELTGTLLAWQEDAVIVEARGLAKGQADWTCCPRLHPAEQ